MAEYANADDWIERSQIPWGTVPENRESIRSSWVATNRAAHVTELTVKEIEDFLMTKRWAWQNQEHIPEDQRGTADFVQFMVATNGQVYRDAGKLDAVLARLASIEAKLDTLIGGSPSE